MLNLSLIIFQVISSRSLPKTDEWSVIAGNTEWVNPQQVTLVENKKVGGTSADLVEDHLLGQYFF